MVKHFQNHPPADPPRSTYLLPGHTASRRNPADPRSPTVPPYRYKDTYLFPRFEVLLIYQKGNNRVFGLPFLWISSSSK